MVQLLVCYSSMYVDAVAADSVTCGGATRGNFQRACLVCEEIERNPTLLIVAVTETLVL
jgi:hypothetical protein